eukprot:gene6992-7736_t
MAWAYSQVYLVVVHGMDLGIEKGHSYSLVDCLSLALLKILQEEEVLTWTIGPFHE